MDNRVRKSVLICDDDTDHSFALEGELRNRDYEVIIINDATELVASAKSLRPVAILANPDMKGFNDNQVCENIKLAMNIPIILIPGKNSTHRGHIGNCRADDIMAKPVDASIIANLIAKQMAWHQSNP